MTPVKYYGGRNYNRPTEITDSIPTTHARRCKGHTAGYKPTPTPRVDLMVTSLHGRLSEERPERVRYIGGAIIGRPTLCAV